MPITATFLPLFAIRVTSAAVSASSISFGAISSVRWCTASNFADRRLVGAVVARRLKCVGHLRRVRLADVDDHERDVEAAFLHLRQVHLVGQPHRVVAAAGEVRRIDVVVRVERDHALVNRARPRDQILFALRLRHDARAVLLPPILPCPPSASPSKSRNQHHSRRLRNRRDRGDRRAFQSMNIVAQPFRAAPRRLETRSSQERARNSAVAALSAVSQQPARFSRQQESKSPRSPRAPRLSRRREEIRTAAAG